MGSGGRSASWVGGRAREMGRRRFVANGLGDESAWVCGEWARVDQR